MRRGPPKSCTILSTILDLLHRSLARITFHAPITPNATAPSPLDRQVGAWTHAAFLLVFDSLKLLQAVLHLGGIW